MYVKKCILISPWEAILFDCRVEKSQPTMRSTQTCQLMGLLLLGILAVASAQDVSTVLAQYPQYSKFNELLKSTGVLTEVNMRYSMTILLPEDGIFNGYVGSHPSYTTQMVADVIRYHCLLQYFGGDELQNLNAQNGAVITTLYQTTGRANGLDGFVNITAQPDGSRSVSPSTPGSPIQANIITNVTQYPYNYSFLQISAVLEPLGLAAAQLAPTTPPSVAPVPAPMTPVEVPVVAPVSSPVSVPVIAPTPVSVPVLAPVAEVPSPVMSPVMTPVPAPATTPVPAPATTPVPAPATTPVPAPDVVAPSPPMINGPSANAPMEAPSSFGFSLQFNVAALVASALVTALLV
ncbi:hypothetical protein M758_UG141000 [Ceratodon purpureus]|nr:hypothetical protein M758_UG141000 [Ceratodon purpureus]